jgi:hypothetical protein
MGLPTRTPAVSGNNVFKHLRLKLTREPIAPAAAGMTAVQLLGEPHLPMSLKSLNRRDEKVQQRVYRALLPVQLLIQFEIDPITWKGPEKRPQVQLHSNPDGVVKIEARAPVAAADPFFTLELADNNFNGIDLNLLLLNDPRAEKFGVDRDEDGRDTLFGAVHRHRAEEARAKAAGLAPGQIRAGLGSSRRLFDQLELFLSGLGHRAIYLEPLTYASAWVFERRGFAYVSGHKLMDEIHQEFQPGGRLHSALDGRSPFRQPEQATTVRGRAWAIHDGILERLDQRWNGLRMVKRLGRHANVNTFPEGAY